MSEKLVLIDGHSILNRAFYGMPDLTNSKGVHTGAVYGFLNIMFRILDEEKPDYLIVAFDVHAPTFRHEAYKEYKGTRHPMPDELREQVPLIKDVLHAMDVFTIEQAGLEADDILGTLAKRAQKEGMEVSLVSGDRDLLQIADEHIQIRIPKTKHGETTVENYYPADVQRTLSVTPQEFIQVKALQGDTADNIPGVPKVGPKTATELIVQYHTVAGVYDHLSDIKKKGLHDTLEANRNLAELSLFLATIRTDCDLVVDKQKAKLSNFYTPKAYELFTELGFKRLLSRFDEKTTQTATEKGSAFSYQRVTDEKEAEEILAGFIAGGQGAESKGAESQGAESQGAENEAENGEKRNIAIYPVFDVPQLQLPDRLVGLGVAAGEKAWFIEADPQGRRLHAGTAVAGKGTAHLKNADDQNNTPVTGNTIRETDLGETDIGETDIGETDIGATDEEEQLSFCFSEGDNGKKSESEVRNDAVTAGWLTEQLQALRREAALGQCRVITFDIKSQYSFWGIDQEEFREGIRLNGMEDLLIKAYLLNPLKNDYAPEDVASEYLGETIVGRRQILERQRTGNISGESDAEHKKTGAEQQGKNSRRSGVNRGPYTFEEKTADDPETVASYAAHIAWSLLRAEKPIQEKLAAAGMAELYEKMELPLSYILYDMQRIGMRVIPEKLKGYGDQLVGRIDELEQKIHKEAGEEFNIASPKQLGEILFEKMKLPGGKKTKTGWSTAADVLEKLSSDYPIVADVLEYRGLTKLKSTYADGLSAFIAKDSRIHTTFHQTITATGRISSTDPNLQNIPMRTDLGRAIRKVFVPREGWSFTDADYSQIELRILASMSGDAALIEAFNENRDIHRTTASKVFHVPFDAVTPAQRRDAKAVNFGIVYGISSFGLSQNLSITRKQAAEYIQEYFHMFPGIKQFLDSLVASAKAKGYSVTMFGRRRPIPELKNSNFMQRQFGERVAMNAPIQGTGADIMKIGMIRVWEGLKRAGLKSELILQIHDELLIETAPGEEEQVRKILVDGMTGAADLKVKLDVDCHQGSDWFEAK